MGCTGHWVSSRSTCTMELTSDHEYEVRQLKMLQMMVSKGTVTT